LSIAISEKIRKFIVDSEKIITTTELAHLFSVQIITASNYLSRLEKSGVITRIGKGEYINYKSFKLKPEIDNEVKTINEKIKEKSPHLDFVIWSILNLKRFLHYIPTQNYIFIEVKEKFEIDIIRSHLIESNIESIVNPDENNFKEFIYKNKIPAIIFLRKSMYGILNIDNILTPNLERAVLDLYFFITRQKLPFPIEEVRMIMEKAIQSGEFNFTFADRYSRIRNMEFEFLIILVFLKHKYPSIVPDRYEKRLKTIHENTKDFFGDELSNDFFRTSF